MRYDPNLHHRRSIRLRGYDYSRAGAYFITICLQGRECLLGTVVGEKIQLNDAGLMVEKWWLELPNKYSEVEIDAAVIMPNHFHGIVLITGAGQPAGATGGDRVGAALRGRPDGGGIDGKPTLGQIVGWFKTMTVNEYIRGVKERGWPPFYGRFWQRNYYEHIVRNEDEMDNIRAYIEANPARWAWDRENRSAMEGWKPQASWQV
jgi:putative transposase